MSYQIDINVRNADIEDLRAELEATRAEIERKMSAGQFVLEQLAAHLQNIATLEAKLAAALAACKAKDEALHWIASQKASGSIHCKATEAIAIQPDDLSALRAHDDALENCRLFAARNRNEEWAKTILRFCSEAGITGSPFRADAIEKGGER